MTKLVKSDEEGGPWYPVSVSNLESFLIKSIKQGHGYTHTYALRKNIAYNLQHIEFLHQCLSDIKMSTVIKTQTWKSIILIGAGILESFLHYLLVKHDEHSKIDWELKIILPGNQKNVDGSQTKIDSHMYKKLSSPKAIQMTFEAMISKSKSKKLLGPSATIYSQLEDIRKLRNKVHLQAIDSTTDTDWNSFNLSDLRKIDDALYFVFTNNIFHPSEQEKVFFAYLTDFHAT